MQQHFHIQCYASIIPFTGLFRLSTNLNPHKSCPCRWGMEAEGSGSNLQHCSNSPASSGALGWVFRNSAAQRWDLSLLWGRKTAAVSYSQPSLAGFSQVSPWNKEGNQQTFPGILMCFSISWAERLQLLKLHFKPGIESHGFGTWFWGFLIVPWGLSYSLACLLVSLCALMCIIRENQGSCLWLGGPDPCTWETQSFSKM